MSTTNTILSTHAAIRSQQRGVPPTVINWLSEYGDRAYDGHGGVIRYFGARCRRRLSGEVGSEALRRVSELLKCYMVESSTDGCIITVGKRYRNTRFPHH